MAATRNLERENVILGMLILLAPACRATTTSLLSRRLRGRGELELPEADFGDGSVSEDFLDALGYHGMNFCE